MAFEVHLQFCWVSNLFLCGSLVMTPGNQKITYDLILIFVCPALLASQKALIFSVGCAKLATVGGPIGGQAEFWTLHPNPAHEPDRSSSSSFSSSTWKHDFEDDNEHEDDLDHGPGACAKANGGHP